MSRLTYLIREDREYKNFASAFSEVASASRPLPIAVNGLTGGAEDAFIVESIRDAIAMELPVIVLTAVDTERDTIAAKLSRVGIKNRVY